MSNVDDHAAAYMEANRRNWDDRAVLHAHPTLGYALDRYRQDRTRLSHVVGFDRRYLGDDLSGVRVLHLQCHIGTDTLSLARLGAEVTGLDQSGASLDAARELFASVDTPGTFVESNVYDAVEALDGRRFDLVYTSIGALNWLPDIARWGDVVGRLVAPDGRLYLRDGHPMAYTIDDERSDGDLRLRYPYFETVEPMTFEQEVTYVDTGGEVVANTRIHEWNHGLGEVFMAVTRAGLRVTLLEEHQFLDWQMIPGQTEDENGLWWLPEAQRDLCPMEYSLLAVRDV